MNVTITLPDEVAWLLASRWGDLSQRALQALLLEAIRDNLLSQSEVGRLLGHGSTTETANLLAQANLTEAPDPAELPPDMAVLRGALRKRAYEQRGASASTRTRPNYR